MTGLLLSLPVARPLLSQEKKQDEKVLLISAQSAQLIEENGQNYRKVIGPAKFFHNNTYLLCDTALWNVSTNIIDAMGHVRIIQDQTQLSSNTLQYVVDDNLARFRGDLVQLEDKDKNTLRTRYLDYNTKDSVAVFQDGAAMRDKDGQVIESLYGTYDSKAHLFVFNDQVNMYMDTTFVKTSRLEYRSDLSTAYFGFATDMWQDDKMLSANDGWYKREEELFFFRRRVHLLTEDQEVWADSLYYERARNNVEMLGKVEVMDSTRNAYALAGRLEYTDSISQIRMTREPAIMSIVEEKNRKDTVYIGADLLLSRAYRRCDIPDVWIKDSEKRVSDISGDPVMEYRRKAAEAAAKAAEAAAANDPNRPPVGPGAPGGKSGEPGAAAGVPGTSGAPGGKPGSANPGSAGNSRKPGRDAKPEVKPQQDTLPQQRDTLMPPVQLDSLATESDTLAVPADTLVTAPVDTTVIPAPLVNPQDQMEPAGDDKAPADSLAAQADSLAALPPLDTTKVNFIWGSRRVRMFRRTMQMASDSLSYTDLDSLVRLYKDPIFFNEGNRQYVSDSIYVVIKNQQMEKAHLLSNAFITIQEDPQSYDQIRGTEMVAYFDSTQALTRFDALGGASSLFFLEEKKALATVNKVDAKMIYATFKDGDIDHIYYYDNPKNDGYPTVQLPEEERQLKGFRWDPERRPASPLDVTSLVPRPSERTSYLARPHAEFKQTNTYFPGYIKKVYRDIAVRDSLQVVRERERQRLKDSLARAEADSLALQALDSLALEAPLDSLASAVAGVPSDSTSVAVAEGVVSSAEGTVTSDETGSLPEKTPEELKKERKAAREAEKARKKAEKQAAKEARQAQLEAKWAEKDLKYEQRKAAKAQRKLDRERARKLKVLRKLEKKAQKERLRYEKYLQKEREKQLKQKK